MTETIQGLSSLALLEIFGVVVVAVGLVVWFVLAVIVRVSNDVDKENRS